ncbi:hypothetical protein CTEN210_03782 [Chaetoceros tenuissimus]|uniref:non-specific serine/threonine protein kinase n=1 Tax=Chaetoceros tenuissimus TaxID=426638 RepID=A0AAD3CJM8_9STRA|nr:hypothetical protein CTEN210_03782 [Chaetoceros tenuissimus]
MKEKEAIVAAILETSGIDTNRNSTSTRGGKNQENDEEDARIVEIGRGGDNSSDKKDIATERSKKVLTRLRSNSSLFGDEVKQGRRSSMSTAVSREDMTIRAQVGKGAFAEVLAFVVKDSPTNATADSTTGYSLADKESSTLVIKTVRGDLDEQEKISSTVDLLIESEFLAHLSHPHIVKLICTGGTMGSPCFFNVMERIAHTLASTIRLMRNEKSLLKFDLLVGDKKRCCISTRRRNYEQYVESYKEKISKRQDCVIQQLGSAIQYLHEHRIIHRDIKPENIGIDDEGNVKLYDFGIAKELKEEDLVRDDQFKATGVVGTFRYMAPEVLNALPYGKAADIYSFTLVIWHLLSLHAPFIGVHGKKICDAYKKIHKKGSRPKLKRDWSRELKSIIARGWNRDPLKRPSIDDYIVAMKQCEEFTF